ncbi:MAG: sulfurtransferase TusA family protein [Euryarchaeota archaeon]|nr:sulfurtransferase TusA family protein [Euryarchaeota archaeon]
MGVKFEKKDEKSYLLDVRGYLCPYPVIFTRKALLQLKEGDFLEVFTDNPASCENVPNDVKEDGHKVLAIEQMGRGEWKIVIKK